MMKIKRFTLSLAALMISSGVAMAAPAAASDHPGTDRSAQKSADSVEVHDMTTKLRQQGEAAVEAQKHDGKQHSQAERQKACAARKDNLTKRMANAVSWATKHKGVIDDAYTRVKAFHDSKGVNVPDYTSLTVAIDNAQSNAQTSIDALSALNVSIDCSSQTVATSVSSFQQAVKSTRDSLKAYRSALVKLIESMKGASTSANTSIKSGEQ